MPDGGAGRTRGSYYRLALVQRYPPEFGKRLRSKLRCTGRCWRVDETYIRIAGEWHYLYRAVDAAGETVDFLLSRSRDSEAARLFFRKATQDIRHLPPDEIVSDGNPSYPACHGTTQARTDIPQVLPAPMLAVSQQHRGTRPPRNQTACGGETMVPIVEWSSERFAGYEAIHMVRKGQVPWAERENAIAQMALFESPLLQPTI